MLCLCHCRASLWVVFLQTPFHANGALHIWAQQINVHQPRCTLTHTLARCRRSGQVCLSCPSSFPGSCSSTFLGSCPCTWSCLISTTGSWFLPLALTCWQPPFAHDLPRGSRAAGGHCCPCVALGALPGGHCSLLLSRLHCAPLLHRHWPACDTNPQQGSTVSRWPTDVFDHGRLVV